MSGVIGREDELAALEAFVHRLSTGPAALVLFGEAGIGKTTLWHAGVVAAQRQGALVLTARPSQSESALPYAGLGDLLADVEGEALDTLPDPQRRALEVALLRTRPEGPALEQRAVGAGAAGVLAALSRTQPVVVAIDDVAWLDVPSTRALTFALRRLGEASVGVLLARRGDFDADVPLGLDRALPDDRLVRVEVGPLPVEALDRLLRDRLGSASLRPVLLQLYRVSGGNPFFALELGRALMRRKAPVRPGEALPVPRSLRDLVAERLAGLSHAGREAALAASALSRPTLAAIRQATGEAGIDEALAAGVLEVDEGQLRFTHPLLASTLYTEASPEARRRLHRRLAEVVTDPEERPRQLALGADGPDAAVAAALDEAAARARARGAPAAAAALAEQALRLTPSELTAELRRRSLAAAEDHFRIGDLLRARQLLEGILPAMPRGSERGRVLQRLGEVRAQELEFRAGEALFTEALAEAGEDSSLRAEVEYDLASIGLVRGDIPEAASHAEKALALAERLGEDRLLLESLSYLLLFEFLNGKGVRADAFQRAIELDDQALGGAILSPPGVLHVSQVLAAILKWTDELDVARTRLVQAYRRSLEFVDERALSYICCHLSELECWAGNWDLAARYATEGCQAAERTAQDEVRSSTLYALALVEAHQGKLEAAQKDAEESVRLCEQRGTTLVMLLSLSVLGFIALSSGDHAGTHRYLGPLTQSLTLMGTLEPAVVRYVPDEIEALVAMGELEQAQTLLDSFEERARALHRTWALATGGRCRGLLRAAQGDLPGALESLEQALKEHERLAQPFELGRTLLVQGTVRRRAKKKRAARESLQQALSIFEPLGAPLWVERTRAELRRIGGRAASPNTLSPTERRIVELVAAGYSNQEIAGALFLSVKTVEGNLTRIYAKLGVGSRRELARLHG